MYNKLDVAYTKNSIVLKRRVEGFNFLLGVLTVEQWRILFATLSVEFAPLATEAASLLALVVCCVSRQHRDSTRLQELEG
jgi:hypothetical protein